MDRHLLLMKWNDKVYIDTCLPFGLCAAPKLFNIIADLLERIARAEGVRHILHYLDNFLILSPPTSLKCQQDLDTIIKICKDLGVPLALGKAEGPSTIPFFLGIILDTAVMETKLPHNRLQRMCNVISTWLKKKKATNRDILSLVGLLQHATKVVQCGRPFLSRMCATAAKVRQMDYHTHLKRDSCSNLHWWNTFLISWNGLSLLRSIPVAPQFHIYTDASGSWGCGALFRDQ